MELYDQGKPPQCILYTKMLMIFKDRQCENIFLSVGLSSRALVTGWENGRWREISPGLFSKLKKSALIFWGK